MLVHNDRRRDVTQERLITLDDLCNRLGGIGRATVYRHIKRLPGFPRIVKVGGATRFRESDLQAYIRGDAAKVEVAKP